MLLKKEKAVLEYYSTHDVGILSRPFYKTAQDLRMTESELVNILCRLQRRGLIKSLRGVIDHRKAGYVANALIAWRIESRRKQVKEELVKELAMNDDRISHCYERKPHQAFNYNIFTMMHAKTTKEIKTFARNAARTLNLDYEILFTNKELKKEQLDLGEVLCRG